MKEDPSGTHEFSRLFPVDKLRDRPVHESIEATEEECEALSRRLNLVALKNFEADLDLQREHSGDVVQVSGNFRAGIVQTCVVTLEPFETDVSESFKAYFARPAPAPEGPDLPVEDERAPEPIPASGEIDLGELAAQHLSLALDPYPRKPGAVFKPPPGIKAEGEKPNPFAVLADFRGKKK
ncbi:MAG: DUF177 domain-containing protein [Proteobacteria bacterium]|nr:DUF177 domain-containing protein [Pseudomonadota bacterium]